jgi:biopolymer transport protein ExbB/TolQ
MKRSHFICLILGLALLFGGPAVGLLATVLGMQRAVAAASANQNAGTAKLAHDVEQALTGTWWGLAVGAAGLVVAIVAIVVHFTSRSVRRAEPGEAHAPIAEERAQ